MKETERERERERDRERERARERKSESESERERARERERESERENAPEGRRPSWTLRKRPPICAPAKSIACIIMIISGCFQLGG